MSTIPFFPPAMIATSIGVSLLCKPLSTTMYGLTAALQGAVGVYILTAIGYQVCSIATAAIIGGLAGAAITAPIAILLGLKSIFESSEDENTGLLGTIAGFCLEIGVIFLASLAISTSLYLGAIPAIAVATGAVATSVTSAFIKDTAQCAMSWITP